MNRLLHVVRIQMLLKRFTLGLPWVVVAISFVTNLLIFALVQPDSPEPRSTGGMMAIYCLMFVTYLITMREYFPFLLGLGVTRRAFYGGTSLVLLAQSVAYGVVLYVLSLIEQATGGWGVQMAFFTPDFVPTGNALAQFLFYTVPFIPIAYLGLLIGSVYRRWGRAGTYTLLIGSAVVLGGTAVLLRTKNLLPAVGGWFQEQSAVNLAVLWPIPIAIVLAAATFLVVRRIRA